eukprot:CAMPEP_0206329276 /NCGR_PEP_ID=MMETSP0106_2-20121207/23114_1 /ASSEMBLY_ACC=CAM_ASM_000206 /TAXON_ID=81532 /ORGANISM="Acanthoeca-like sp., Strain 10tr" /LENGTH=213 /DNA_ID=CAMNT_0053761987 /DNA_START=39 /DNA_END=676 /DNA_ORIENTATION=-
MRHVHDPAYVHRTSVHKYCDDGHARLERCCDGRAQLPSPPPITKTTASAACATRVAFSTSAFDGVPEIGGWSLTEVRSGLPLASCMASNGDWMHHQSVAEVAFLQTTSADSSPPPVPPAISVFVCAFPPMTAIFLPRFRGRAVGPPVTTALLDSRVSPWSDVRLVTQLMVLGRSNNLRSVVRLSLKRVKEAKAHPDTETVGHRGVKLRLVNEM